MSHSIVSRRRFLSLAAAATAGALLMTRAQSAHADELPHLSESDPTAMALGYREDPAKIDSAKYPQFKKEQTCGNCRFYQGTGAYGACQLFPGKSVATKGWCGGYAVKA